MTLLFKDNVSRPAHCIGGGFDHGDVHSRTGRVFVAHTANSAVDVIDGPALRLERTVTGCAEGSGVLCATNASERG